MNRRDFLKAAGSVLYWIMHMLTNSSYGKPQVSRSQPKKTYLEGLEITDGLFSHEKAVRLADYEDDETSGFFENEHIQNGKLEVKVFEEKNNLVMVKLPGRTLEAPGDKGYITVRKNQLEYAA